MKGEKAIFLGGGMSMQGWGTDGGRAGTLCLFMADPDLKSPVAQSFFQLNQISLLAFCLLKSTQS